MNERTNEWMNKWIKNEWRKERRKKWRESGRKEKMKEGKKEWMGGWMMEEWVNEYYKKWMNEGRNGWMDDGMNGRYRKIYKWINSDRFYWPKREGDKSPLELNLQCKYDLNHNTRWENEAHQQGHSCDAKVYKTYQYNFMNKILNLKSCMISRHGHFTCYLLISLKSIYSHGQFQFLLMHTVNAGSCGTFLRWQLKKALQLPHAILKCTTFTSIPCTHQLRLELTMK